MNLLDPLTFLISLLLYKNISKELFQVPKYCIIVDLVIISISNQQNISGQDIKDISIIGKLNHISLLQALCCKDESRHCNVMSIISLCHCIYLLRGDSFAAHLAKTIQVLHAFSPIMYLENTVFHQLRLWQTPFASSTRINVFISANAWNEERSWRTSNELQSSACYVWKKDYKKIFLT